MTADHKPLTDQERVAAMALEAKATRGPWSIESCGEKGDGANMIGVSFGPKDMNAEHPLEGWLKPFDDDGEEIEYYRDELVAECDHHNRNAGHDAAFIAAARTLLPRYEATVAALEAKLAEVTAQNERWSRTFHKGAGSPP